jgi:hypothetical protein
MDDKLKAKFAAASIDVDQVITVITSFNWLEFFAFIKQLVALFKGTPAASRTFAVATDAADAKEAALLEIEKCGT